MSPRHLFTLSLLITFCFVTINGKSKSCVLNLKKDLRPGHPLILKANASELLYPTDKKLKFPSGEVALRITCPGGQIVIKSKETNRSSVDIVCTDKGKFRFADSNDTIPEFQIKELKCNASIQSTSHLLPSNTKGLSRAQIGLQLSDSVTNGSQPEVLVTIDEVVAGLSRGQLVRWAKIRIPPTILNREISKIVPTYRKGAFYQDVDMNDVYVRANQRASFLEVFNSTEEVDKYLSETGNGYFVQGQLISRDDLFYEAQQDAAHIYDNIVPVWQTIATNGNWKLVGDLVRSRASITTNGLEVWSGAYQQLYLNDNKQGDIKFISLSHGIEPPQFLFKYVHDATSNRGLVFVTVNNPYAEKVSSHDIICDKYSSCDILYPEFSDLSKGYTYCCRLEDFRLYASMFGLPIFSETTPLL